jgi:hypothetical protein
MTGSHMLPSHAHRTMPAFITNDAETLGDSTNLLRRDNSIGNEPELAKEGHSNDSSLSNVPEPSVSSIEFEGYSIGL